MLLRSLSTAAHELAKLTEKYVALHYDPDGPANLLTFSLSISRVDATNNFQNGATCFDIYNLRVDYCILLMKSYVECKNS